MMRSSSVLWADSIDKENEADVVLFMVVEPDKYAVLMQLRV